MGEESDGDANLLEDDSDPQPEEADEPTASESDDPDSGASDADTEPSDSSPSGEPAEDGDSPSTDPPAVEPEDDGTDAGAESDADADDTIDADAETDDATETDGEADEEPPEDAGMGNLQPVENSDIPHESARRPRPAEPEEPPDGPGRPPESPAETDRPPEQSERAGELDSPEGGSAPLAEDVARPDSIEEAAERSEPLEDEEMPLADHIEEMLKRLAVVLVIAGVVSLAVLPFSETVINFLWNSILPAGESTRPRLYGPLALVFTKLKVASLAGLVVALPVFVYETYQFMRPGLYPHERRYYLAAVPTSLVLAVVGISFAYFLVLPVIFTYFLYYSEDVTTIAFALTKTFNLILLLMGYLAIVFQIPLFIMLAIMMGLTTRRWLTERRLYFWGAFLGIAFLFSPDPTGMAPIMVAATMVALFEGTLFLLKWTGR